MSAPEPGEFGTTMRIGRLGYACTGSAAAAIELAAVIAAAQAAALARRFICSLSMSALPVFSQSQQINLFYGS